MKAFVTVILACLLSSAVAAQDAVPAALQDVGVAEKLGAALPLDLPLLNEHGQPVTLRDCLSPGKPAVLQLSYFNCPMLCDSISQGLLRSMQDLDLVIGKDFDVIDVSFDGRDTPTAAYQKKKTYVQQYDHAGSADGWHFLVGSEASTKAICDAVGYKYKWIAENQQFAHPAVLMILSPDGRIMRYLYGVEFPKDTLRLSLVEASQGKIGTTLDQILMICFHYNSTEGRYTLAAMTLMRAGGILTVLILGAILTRLFLKERRQRPAMQ